MKKNNGHITKNIHWNRDNRREHSMQLISIFARLNFLLRQQIIKSTERA